MCQVSVLKNHHSRSQHSIAASKTVVLMLQLPGYSLPIMNGLGYWPPAWTKIWQSASSLHKSLQWRQHQTTCWVSESSNTFRSQKAHRTIPFSSLQLIKTQSIIKSVLIHYFCLSNLYLRELICKRQLEHANISDAFPANVIEELTFLASAAVNCHRLNIKWKQSLSWLHLKKKKKKIKSY